MKVINASTLYSVGHGDRPVEELLELLAGQGIRTLVDMAPTRNPAGTHDATTRRCAPRWNRQASSVTGPAASLADGASRASIQGMPR
jgi:hypothetical protein